MSMAMSMDTQQVSSADMYLDSTFYAVPDDFYPAKKKDADEADDIFV